MSTTLPESVTTTNTTTSTTVVSNEPRVALDSINGPSTTERASELAKNAAASIQTNAKIAGAAISQAASQAGHAISNAASNAAAVIKEKTSSDSTTEVAATERQPRDALDSINGPSASERASEAMKSAAASISSGATSAAHSISAAASSAAHAISEKSHEIDAKYHLGDKAKDMTSHMGSALKHGNPVHAVKHAGTAAAIGEAERAKHEQGQLPEGAHSAETGVGNVSSSNVVSSTGGSSTSEASTFSSQVSDSAAFSKAAVAAGNPVFAAKNVLTAAKIGEAEAHKHQAGNLENEKDISAVTK